MVPNLSVNSYHSSHLSVEIDIQIVFLILERFSPPTACGPAMYMILNDPEPGSDSVLDI